MVPPAPILLQQRWLPTPALLKQWWLPIVNGWCCPFSAHAMATTQYSLLLPKEKIV